MRQLPRFGRERHRRFLATAPIVLSGGDLAVRKPVILQLVHRHLVRAGHELPIARLPHLQRHALLQIVEMCRRNDVESGKIDRTNEHRLAFRDRDRQIDFVLPVVELHVEAGDARVGESTIGVERLHALQVRVEARTVEDIFLAPGHFRTLAGRERIVQAADVNRVDAVEGEAVHRDGSAFLARSGTHEGREHERGDREAHHEHVGSPEADQAGLERVNAFTSLAEGRTRAAARRRRRRRSPPCVWRPDPALPSATA